MQQDNLTFFGGVDESGGVQIVYERGGKALLFDFGTAHHCLLDPAYLNTSDPVRPTPGRELRQYLLGKMAPPLPELYSPEHLQGLDTETLRPLWNDRDFPKYADIGIFIGHMHQDHMSLLPFARKGIPVFMHRDAYSLYRGIVYSRQYPDTEASLVPCDDRSVLDFGEFSVQIIEMDHNTPGSSAIVIESPEHKIAVTGDWRLHGKHPERIDRFIELCRRKGIDILITEGTRVGKGAAFQNSRTEAKSLSMFSAVLDESEGLVYVQTSPRDLERMADLIQMAADKGRKIVMDGSIAAIWHTATREGIAALDNHPALLASLQIMEGTIPDGVRLPYETVLLEEVAKRKNECLYVMRFPNLGHWIELETLGGRRGDSHYVQADNSIKPDNPKLAQFLDVFGITGHAIGNKGHAAPDEISDLIERIAPRMVIPVHTLHREQLDTRGVKVYFPERGETRSISELLAAAVAR
ncbi:hypothetical protein [Paenibacillus ginsengarvi]|uniref:Metallo-beta-lactamase domain-containing protein n=1 Tax=Paenibacillus ginsengarvi TaxID=400777 RepID=A0A3B0C8V4_9BACL|nr:hypothetical protein [Paenibacillus ginsengarvi]RKN81980.1 hypothetical protein D7M11_18555 [Paenibacillus ginsengarvi]